MPLVNLNIYHKKENQLQKLIFLNKNHRRKRDYIQIELSNSFNLDINPIRKIVKYLLSHLEVIRSHPIVNIGEQRIAVNISFRLTASVKAVGNRYQVTFYIEGDEVQFKFNIPDSDDHFFTEYKIIKDESHVETKVEEPTENKDKNCATSNCEILP